MTNIINNKYKIIEKIGEGSFGFIYKGQNIRTQEYVAIKVESIKSGMKLLKNESIVYHFLNNCPGIPNVKWFGKDVVNYYMVINLLGESLQSLKEKHTIFSLQHVLQIGIHIINLLNIIHDKGLVHRDIKPDNFLFSLHNENKQIYIIDFGFCKSFMLNDKHIELKKTNNLIGSKTYASINSHNFLELSRRDDLESLGYMLIYFYLGTVSWNDISNLNSNDVNQSIKQLKINIINDMTLPKVLTNYMKYVKSLEFKDRPNYKFILNDFKKEMESISIS
jgi:serine/threonine protein kinase